MESRPNLRVLNIKLICTKIASKKNYDIFRPKFSKPIFHRKWIFAVFEVLVQKVEAPIPKSASKTFFYLVEASKSHTWIVFKFSL